MLEVLTGARCRERSWSTHVMYLCVRQFIVSVGYQSGRYHLASCFPLQLRPDTSDFSSRSVLSVMSTSTRDGLPWCRRAWIPRTHSHGRETVIYRNACSLQTRKIAVKRQQMLIISVDVLQLKNYTDPPITVDRFWEKNNELTAVKILEEILSIDVKSGRTMLQILAETRT